jgi:hypothetical protein
MLLVCKVIGTHSDATLNHAESLEAGRQTVYNVCVAGVGEFLFLLSILGLLYSKASYNFEIASTYVLW